MRKPLRDRFEQWILASNGVEHLDITTKTEHGKKIADYLVLYRLRFLRHRFESYAASAAVGSCSVRIAAGGRKPCRSMSQVAL